MNNEYELMIWYISNKSILSVRVRRPRYVPSLLLRENATFTATPSGASGNPQCQIYLSIHLCIYLYIYSYIYFYINLYLSLWQPSMSDSCKTSASSIEYALAGTVFSFWACKLSSSTNASQDFSPTSAYHGLRLQ